MNHSTTTTQLLETLERLRTEGGGEGEGEVEVEEEEEGEGEVEGEGEQQQQQQTLLQQIIQFIKQLNNSPKPDQQQFIQLFLNLTIQTQTHHNHTSILINALKKLKSLDIQLQKTETDQPNPLEIQQFIRSEPCWMNLFQHALDPRNQSRLERQGQDDLVDLLTEELTTTSLDLSLPLPQILFRFYQLEQAHVHLNPALLARRIFINWAKLDPHQFFKFLNQIIFTPSPAHLLDRFLPPAYHITTVNPNLVELETSEEEEFDSLSLLIDFITHFPYSIHKIQQTDLLSNLVRSVIEHGRDPADEGQRVKPGPVALIRYKLTLDAIVTILPRLSSMIGVYLPFLLVGLARALEYAATNGWAAGDGLEGSVRDLFSFLYGVAPCNLLEFLRAPAESWASFSGADPASPSPPAAAGAEPDAGLAVLAAGVPARLDAARLQTLCAPLLHAHALSLALVRMRNAAAERKEIANRLRFYEAPEILERCQRPLRLPPPPASLASPDQLPPDQHEDGHGTPSLQTQIALLKTQLNLELYLKSQHLQQLGFAHKHHIVGAGLEAENQNLLRMNKELKKKLESLQTYKETSELAKLKNRANKLDYLAMIKAKSVQLKDENMRILSDKARLLDALAALEKGLSLKSRNFDLLQIESHDLRNQLVLIQPKLSLIEELEKRNESLSKALLTWDDDLRRMRESRQQINGIRGRWKRAESLAACAGLENAHLRHQLQAQLARAHHLAAQNRFLRARRRPPCPAQQSAPAPVALDAMDAALGVDGMDAVPAPASAASGVDGLDAAAAAHEPVDEPPDRPTPPHVVAALRHQLAAYRELTRTLKLQLVQMGTASAPPSLG